jgi:AcrR family transcriptional regulator
MSERRAEILDAAARVFGASGVRASMQQVADECGILAGSLYHHFESKDEILVELVSNYQSELDALADKALEDRGTDPRSPEKRIVALAVEIADCGIRNRAALLLTFREPPVGSSARLLELAGRAPTRIEAAMQALLSDASDARYLRPEVEILALARRICAGMLAIGIGVYHRSPGAEAIPAVKARLLVHGVATDAPDNAGLDRSPAREAADAAIAAWESAEGTGDDDRVAHLRAVARREFARRGYDLTTIRHIAAAAGMPTGTVNRLIGTKARLIMAIMGSYADIVTSGWASILATDSSPVEKLDALLWFDANVVDGFPEERRIEAASMQLSPLATPDLPVTYSTQLRLLADLVAEGLAAGQLQFEGASLDLAAHCVFSLVWPLGTMVRSAGVERTFQFEREVIVRGAAEPARKPLQ